jgi:crotonobetainyl-CoA:carnitine CoA-transferase CaiB-like acyl-CoA transferase
MPGPLEGIRVLDFTIAQQGPYATLLLADMGAEVIKVEGRERGEVGRLLGIDRRNGFSAYFLAINRGKKSIKLDLKCDKGREVALRLARDCDIVAHNFRPGVMEKLGLGYDAFRAVNPRVIYAGASAFGTKGPLGRKPGNDILAQAMSGLMSVTGEGNAPLPAGCAIADHTAALTFALGIVSALVARERTGVGQEIECSLLASMMAAQSWEMTYFSMIGANPSPAGRGHTSIAWQWWTYRTANGWLAIGGVDPARWPGFCRAIGREDLVTDERFENAGNRIRHRESLNAVVEEHLMTRKTEEWLPALEGEDIFCAPVLDYQQVLSHEQVRANVYTAEIDHPRAGRATVIPTPIAFSETPVDSTRPEPLHGEHTEEVLREFGFGDEEMEELRQARVV